MIVVIWIVIIVFVVIMISAKYRKGSEMIDKLEGLEKITDEEANYLRANILDNNTMKYVKELYARKIDMNADAATAQFMKDIDNSSKEATICTADSSYNFMNLNNEVNPIKEKGRNRCKRL